eukprot:scaffold6232_cov104-Cyclotella_meneghiniana.AAC.5
MFVSKQQPFSAGPPSPMPHPVALVAIAHSTQYPFKLSFISPFTLYRLEQGHQPPTLTEDLLGIFVYLRLE